MSPIIAHPDVKRMLLTMRALTGAARAISLCHRGRDRPRRTAAPTRRHATAANERASLLTPIAKAFATDVGCEVASLGVQVHGGMGYIEETGAAQHFRDARIAAIYEGTNGIQAIDLVTRKLPMSGGDAVRAYIGELRAHRRCGQGRQRSGLRRHRRAARRRDRQPRARDRMAAQGIRRATRRWPARRLICGCSPMPPAARCWPSRRWPPRAWRATVPHPRASRWRGFSPRILRSRRRAWNAPSPKADDSVNCQRGGAGVNGLPPPTSRSD